MRACQSVPLAASQRFVQVPVGQVVLVLDLDVSHQQVGAVVEHLVQHAFGETDQEHQDGVPRRDAADGDETSERVSPEIPPPQEKNHHRLDRRLEREKVFSAMGTSKERSW